MEQTNQHFRKFKFAFLRIDQPEAHALNSKSMKLILYLSFSPSLTFDLWKTIENSIPFHHITNLIVLWVSPEIDPIMLCDDAGDAGDIKLWALANHGPVFASFEQLQGRKENKRIWLWWNNFVHDRSSKHQGSKDMDDHQQRNKLISQ